MASSSTLPSSDLDDYPSSDPLHTPHLPAVQNPGHASLLDAAVPSQSSGIDFNLLLQGLVAYSQESATLHPTPTMVCHLVHFRDFGLHKHEC